MLCKSLLLLGGDLWIHGEELKETKDREPKQP